MVNNKARQKITRLMHAHQEWLNNWQKRGSFSVEYISPRGKSMTYSAYCFEVSKHLNKTIDKIATIVKEDGASFPTPEAKPEIQAD